MKGVLVDLPNALILLGEAICDYLNDKVGSCPLTQSH